MWYYYCLTMSKVTSKYQVSIPKTLAEKIGIRVGDELEWEEAAGTLRARAATLPKAGFPVSERLRLFDAATASQEKRERAHRLPRDKSRGWSREDLYRR
jgi:AbrB family looped-hinge helix DNA binding protein